jgi:hypothetical protein
MIVFSFLLKSRLLISKLAVASIVNDRPSVFTGNVNFNPVISEIGTASTAGTENIIKRINKNFIMQQ